ncbi:hypothetical protein RRG08_031361 [Elysia crispata]|uniref:Uncharacterized protein n=1 Tax=Elysia crispata TaxID=231223 RepID=A0AAE1CZ97_9GAST|nr:hypothetical protein RRG08_031361 [Elysia crispata]
MDSSLTPSDTTLILAKDIKKRKEEIARLIVRGTAEINSGISQCIPYTPDLLSLIGCRDGADHADRVEDVVKEDNPRSKAADVNFQTAAFTDSKTRTHYAFVCFNLIIFQLRIDLRSVPCFSPPVRDSPVGTLLGLPKLSPLHTAVQHLPGYPHSRLATSTLKAFSLKTMAGLDA